MSKTMYGMTVKEASERLGISAAAVRILMKRGKLPIGMATQLTGQRYVFYKINFENSGPSGPFLIHKNTF